MSSNELRCQSGRNAPFVKSIDSVLLLKERLEQLVEGISKIRGTSESCMIEDNSLRLFES